MGYEAISRDQTDWNPFMLFISNYSIHIEGTLVEWEIFLVRQSTISLQVWRADERDSLLFHLVDEETYQEANAGFQRLSANIQVQPGDVLGWYIYRQSKFYFHRHDMNFSMNIFTR